MTPLEVQTIRGHPMNVEETKFVLELTSAEIRYKLFKMSKALKPTDVFLSEFLTKGGMCSCIS